MLRQAVLETGAVCAAQVLVGAGNRYNRYILPGVRLGLGRCRTSLKMPHPKK